MPEYRTTAMLGTLLSLFKEGVLSLGPTGPPSRKQHKVPPVQGRDIRVTADKLPNWNSATLPC